MFREDEYFSEFFKHFLFGLKFDSGDFAAAAMLGLYPGQDDDGEDSIDIAIYGGVNVGIMDGLSVNADISMYVEGGVEDGAYADFGLQVHYSSDDIWAELTASAYNLTGNEPDYQKPNADGEMEGELMFGLDFKLGFRSSHDGDEHKQFALAADDGFYAGARLWSNDLVPDTSLFNAYVGAGFAGDITDTLSYNLYGHFGMGLWKEAAAEPDKFDSANEIHFGLHPELVWNLIPNGNITFGYNMCFGTSKVGDADAVSGLDDHSVTVTFKWWF